MKSSYNIDSMLVLCFRSDVFIALKRKKKRKRKQQGQAPLFFTYFSNKNLITTNPQQNDKTDH